MKLRPTLWRTCRVIASETRLKLLWQLFETGELCVQELVERTGISRPNASNQLRALNARGLITPRREDMRVIYRAEANTEIGFAEPLLTTLRTCFDCSMTFKTIIQQATAFTHERRIEIVRALDGKKLQFHELLEATALSSAALSRHLRKLEDRGIVRGIGGQYRLSRTGNPLGRTLVKIVCA